MDSFYVGYGNGAFSMIQALSDNVPLRSILSAPEQAAYAVKNVTSESEDKSGVQLRFYDANLKNSMEAATHAVSPRINSAFQNVLWPLQIYLKH